MSEIVYLNGEYLLRDEAVISPDDRGFIFADGVYEVIKYYAGKPFGIEEHFERLERSLGEIRLDYEGVAALSPVFGRLLEENHLTRTDAGIYVQITRGVSRRQHAFPKEIEPSVYVFAFPAPSFAENIEHGIKVITHEDIRWLRCDIKSVALLPNTMLYNQAFENGAGECILIRNGKVTEATHSSVFAVKEGKVITHPLSNMILPGITRKVVLEICRENKIPVEERAISETGLFELDELLITGTISEITPVVQINDVLVGNGIPGEITRLIQKKFFEMVR